MAKNVTGKDNETEAVREFRKKLDSPDNYFNNEAFPANESDALAHARCSTIDGAKKYCPMRWKALQSWFKEARMVRDQPNRFLESTEDECGIVSEDYCYFSCIYLRLWRF